MNVDLVIILIYFVFLTAIGFAFRSASTSTSDYFKGGGKMQWWMVGATAFMMQISAMSFTGLMGKALTGGVAVAVVFFANAMGYFANYLFFAAKARQMRVVSPIQGIRLRFGRVNEQVFTWGIVPVNIIQASIWLNALAVFVSPVLGVDLSTTIIISGSVVVFMSLVGGSWAVVASDFLQMVLLTVMTFFAAVVAIWKSGGVSAVYANGLPTHAFVGEGYSSMSLFIGWFILIFFRQFFQTNNMIDSYRYIAAKNTNHARKAAILAGSLILIGPFIWFVPALFVAGHYPDATTWGIDVLGNKLTDATYYIFVKREMPLGMIGLLVAAMFAATMSSMDSALNRNSGIFVKNVYEPYFGKGKDEKHLMLVSKLFTAGLGFLIIVAGLYMTALKNYGLFDAMMLVGSLITFPILIPSILCFFVKKTPDWAGWGTIVVGLCVSSIIAFGITPEFVQHMMGMDHLPTPREFAEFKSVTAGTMGHMCITLPFFFLTRLFYKEPTPERAKEINQFFSNVETPVVTDDEDEITEIDDLQYRVLGKMLLAASACIALLVFVNNPLWGRFLFLLMSGMVGTLGMVLYRKRHSSQQRKLSKVTSS
ncbi:sodium:solute symporter family transporter [Vibrio ezurae]|uniref:Putative SSS family transporter n=1 Tax=Vibrio ezurae NBRC 102218 TaxID=1219080 RepID=U3CQH1_9VIBR|nr:SSS family transporter [Vibrio ezurae]GAD80348.1 putative SSS family transporter [Vibrio ezurae NBRC 102218]